MSITYNTSEVTRRLILAALAVAIVVLCPAVVPVTAETDLDLLMKQVLGHRDENWRKLQQYVLDERERIEVRGGSRQPIWGEEREYAWYIRDGFFVRSPVKVNGAAVSEAGRRKSENDFLERQKRRDERERNRPNAAPATSPTDEP